MLRFFRDVSLPALSAGFVAVLVGFTSSVAIVLQAAKGLGASQEMVASWMWALGLGMGLCTALPSLYWRLPIMVAWSTPGAAVLAVAAAGGDFTMAQAVGAFILSAIAITLCGATGWFERVMNRIPIALASALLAGVLARFGMQAFLAAESALGLVVMMLLVYLLGRWIFPRYSVPVTLLAALVYSALNGQFHWDAHSFALAKPLFTVPEFTWQAFVSLALPLFVVTMASQNLPGIAAIRASGYGQGPDGHQDSEESQSKNDLVIPVSKVITISGIATLLLAPFGAFALNLSAITAAICMGEEAGPDRRKRYTAAVSCGLLYIVLGIFGASVAGLLLAVPPALVAAIAGLALLGTIGNSLNAALAGEAHREAAVITFLVTLSGVSIAGVGSAFWGVLAGALALFMPHCATILSLTAARLKRKNRP
jgi:benzoate membrane transport protein